MHAEIIESRRSSPQAWSRRALASACLCMAVTAGAAPAPLVGKAGGAPENQPADRHALKLHVASPDWRDQIIYFLLTDRFNDGDPTNNDLGAGEYNPADNARYNGGDLRGIEQKLDYIRALGATAIWITPPVANQWWDPQHQYSGYHGYWAENFKAVDRHLGGLDDYRRLSHQIHSAGMYLIQDIVVNHTGNFFSYGNGWRAREPARDYLPNPGSLPVTRPSQPPFDLNDPRDPRQRRAGIYHWTPAVVDYTSVNQEHTFQMAGLDDLNTENPRVRAALRDSYGFWIREVGVDAFRVDTAFYVPPDYFRDFLNARDPQAPGVAEVARQTGRDNFLVFGEGFGIDTGLSDTFSRKIERYMTGADGRPVLPGMLNFPLYGTAADVFARGKPTSELGARITRMMTLHRRPHLMPTFVDNHDVDRFLSGGSVAALKQHLLLNMTLPGIPTIYYGTEQGFTVPRAAMFKSGFQSGGIDRFDVNAPLYKFIQSVSALRRNHKVLSRGFPKVLKQNAAAPGALAYGMTLDREQVLVAFNSADAETLMDNVATGLPAGTRLRGLFAIDAMAPDMVVGKGGLLSMKLPPRAGLVWHAEGTSAEPEWRGPHIAIGRLAGQVRTGDFGITGTANPGQVVRLAIDGELARAQTAVADATGRWQATIDTSRMIDPGTVHQLVAFTEASDGSLTSVSRPQEFRISRAWKTMAQRDDPAGDDTGPERRYVYPTDPGWGANRQMDIRRVKVSEAGGSLKIDLTMNKVTATWNPQNGFDHVAFTLFIQMPGRDGAQRLMPLQNAQLPGGMAWHFRLRAHGWSNALFAATGSSATAEGTPVTPGADIRVNPRTNTISFVLPAAALGNPSTLSGARLYITTWDYDGGYRQLGAQATGHTMGGGDMQRDALILDDTGVIDLP